MRSWIAAIAMTSAGCVGLEQAPVEPFLGASGRADVADRVSILGELEVGSGVSGELFEDLQFDAYVFEVSEDAIVTVETTLDGTWQELDNTLFVYGPEGSDGHFGSSYIDFDDNSGWGAHARIEDLSVPAAGRYLVVTGSIHGTGRGRYRLELRCANEEGCEPEIDETAAPAAPAT